MKWISFLSTIGLVVLTQIAFADAPPSYHQQHPLAFMYGLPVGELPGWTEKWWVNFEMGNGNVWNAPLKMTDKKTGVLYEYTADFEQNNAILDFGWQWSDDVAVGIELPFAERSGGDMDNVIDTFHVTIGNRRFNRQYYPENQNIFSIKTAGTEYFSDTHYNGGLSNFRLKFKWWFLKWMSNNDDTCPCGISVASQTKLPVDDPKHGGTTGGIDESLLLNIGVPMFERSSAWFTLAYTFLGDFRAMEDWPRNHDVVMYEMNLLLAFNSQWGLILNARAESPFLRKKRLEYFDLSSDPAIRSRNRVASGWSSLVNWRGSEGVGVRYRTRSGNVIQFMMVEDWGVGSYDTSDNLYTNDAPDVNFVYQAHF